MKQAFDLLTPEEVIKELHVTKRTLYRWNNAGILKPVKIGGKNGKMLYRMSDLVKLAQKGK